MLALEFDGADKIEQADVGAHLQEVSRQHAVGALSSALVRRGPYLGGRHAAAEMHHHLGGMHRKQCIGRDLARGCTEQQIRTGRITIDGAGEEIAAQFAAGLLELDAGSAVLRLEAAIADHRAPDPSRGAAIAQHCAHRQRLIEIAAGRREVDGQLAIAELPQEFLEARGGGAVDLTFHRDPAVAAASARVSRALDDIEHHRRRRHCRGRSSSEARRRPGRRTEQDKNDDQKCAQRHGVFGPRRPSRLATLTSRPARGNRWLQGVPPGVNDDVTNLQQA